MGITSKIVDALSGKPAKVTSRGQLVTAPLEFSSTTSIKLEVVDTAYTLSSPKTNKQGVITDIIISGDKNIGTNGSILEIYEATDSTTTTVSKAILTASIAKSGNMVLTNLNWPFSEGVWLSAKCDDDNIYITYGGYYIDSEED